MLRRCKSTFLSWCALAAAFQAGCQQPNKYVAPPPPAVTVAKPIQRAVTEYVEFTGMTRAEANVEIKSRVSGYLQNIHFKDGALVKQGDLLFTIDKTLFEAALQSAKANQEKAKVMLQLNDAKLARIQRLADKNVTSQEELDVAVAEKASAAAEVAASAAAVRHAQLNLQFTEIRSPISGRIGRRLFDIGNLVKAEETLLAKIESVDPIHAYFNVSEDILLRYLSFRQHNPQDVKKPLKFEMSLGDTNDYRYSGTLDFQSFGLEPGTGTTLQRAVFTNKDFQLLPGLFVRVRTAVSDPKPKLMVEERAIASDQRGTYLLVVNDKKIVEYRLAKLGALQNGLRVVEEGLLPTDHVVINGLQRARPGTTVEPQLVEMGAIPSSPKQNEKPKTASMKS